MIQPWAMFHGPHYYTAIVILSLHVSLCTCCCIPVVYVVCKLLSTSILHLHNYMSMKSYPNFAAASNSCTLRTKSGYTHMYTYFVVNCRLTQYHVSHFSKHELPVYIFQSPKHSWLSSLLAEKCSVQCVATYMYNVSVCLSTGNMWFI